MKFGSVSLLVCFGALSFVSAAVLDEALSSGLRSHLYEDNLLFILKDIHRPRRPARNTHQVVFSVTAHTHQRFALALNWERGQVVVETLSDEKVERKDLQADVLRSMDKLDSILLDLSQEDNTGRVYVNCELIGTVLLSKSLRDVMSERPQIQVYRGRNTDLTLDWGGHLLEILDKLGCNDDLAKEFQSQANQIYTYRRGDIPSTSEDEKASVLVTTLTDLIETINELQVEIQSQREETALLRDALINCEICKTGRGLNVY